jgi:hypothetical protein
MDAPDKEEKAFRRGWLLAAMVIAGTYLICWSYMLLSGPKLFHPLSPLEIPPSTKPSR